MALTNMSLSLIHTQQPTLYMQHGLQIQDAAGYNSLYTTRLTSSSLINRPCSAIGMGMMMSCNKTLTIARLIPQSKYSEQDHGAQLNDRSTDHWQKKLQAAGRSGLTTYRQCTQVTAARLHRTPQVSICASLQTNSGVKQLVQISNPADILLEKLSEAEPAAPLASNSSAADSVTALVNRLFLWDSLPKSDKVQTFSVYEINELDRESPAYLGFSIFNFNKKITGGFLGWLKNAENTLKGAHGIGDLIPFSNKLYDGSLTRRLGITAGLTMVVQDFPGQGSVQDKSHKLFFPDRYEAMYTFYMGDLGHISVQGPFITFQDTLLTVTGGAGLFREAKGVVHLHNITPYKLLYTFYLKHIPEIPQCLTAQVVEPNEDVKPVPNAVACKPGSTLPNYTE
jgi:allene oxide cyclase